VGGRLDFDSIIKDAWSTFLEEYSEGRVNLLSEGDVQSELYRLCREGIMKRGGARPLALHTQVSIAGPVVDLMLGQREILVEIKLERQGTGGYTSHLGQYVETTTKLRSYKEQGARAILLAIDETGYLARDDRRNFFDPASHGLVGKWERLSNGSYALFSEYAGSAAQ